MEAVEKDRPLYELGGNLNRAVKQKDYQKSWICTISPGLTSSVRNLWVKQLSREGCLYLRIRCATSSPLEGCGLKSKNRSNQSNEISGEGSAVTKQPYLFLVRLKAEEHMELIGVLLELGVDDNPIWVWLLSRYDGLKNKITALVDRSKVEIEIIRRKLAARKQPPPSEIAMYLRRGAKQSSEPLDSEGVLELWEAVTTYLIKLLSHSSGLLGEVIDFWDSAKSFIGGHKQQSLPQGFEGESRKHHRLSDAGVRDLSNGAVELVNMIREGVTSLLSDPPTDDISSLVSPSSASTPKTPASAVFSPTNGQMGRIDARDVPGPSGRDAPWAGFAFWPPHSNSLSAVHYLEKCLTLVATAAGEMAALGPIVSSNSTTDKIRSLVNVARERCLKAVCEAWARDAENCQSMEDWSRAPEKKDQTRLLIHFDSFERTVLSGLQQVMYFTEAVQRPEARNLVTAPPSKLLQMARNHFR